MKIDNMIQDFDSIKIEKYEKMEVPQFYHTFIRFYLIANAVNKKNNDAKGKKIFYAQIIFLIGLIFIPILLGFLIHAYFINAIASDVKEDKEQKSNQTSKKEVDERLKIINHSSNLRYSKIFST